MLAYVAVAILSLIAVLHSVLGEAALLRPLFAKPWEVGIPRFAAERIFRFAWHLTSIAWVGLAAAVAGMPLLYAAGLVCVLSGIVVFAALRGHLAWPLFLAAGACMWVSAGAVPTPVVQGLSLCGAVLAVLLAGLHVYWGAGGLWRLDVAGPQPADGASPFRPPAWACFAVSAACALLAALLVWPSVAVAPLMVRVLLWIALAVFVARAVGDGKQVGFSKADHSTRFAQADDSLYSPLVVGLAFACSSALLLA